MKYIKLFEEFKYEDWEIISASPYDIQKAILDEINKKDTDIDYIKNLFEYSGVDINSNLKADYSFLHWAVFKYKPELVKLLLDMGANPNKMNDMKVTPFDFAIQYEYDDLIMLLIKYGANPNSVDEYGDTALHICASNGKGKIIKILLDAGANPNVFDGSRRTPLHHAAIEGYAAISKLLLKAGAKTEVFDLHGQTPLHYAAENNHYKVVSALLDAGADYEAENKNYWNPVDLAHQEKNKETINAFNQFFGHVSEGYLGSCVEVGDEESECSINNIFSDATEMAYYVGNPDEDDMGRSMEISEEEFFENIKKDTIVKKYLKGEVKYYYLPDLDIYFIYNEDQDVHYFYKR